MKRIIFKINHFPQLSETFVVQQLITALNLGFDVKIIVHKLLDEKIAYYSEEFKKYSLNEKIIIEDYKIPKQHLFRYLKMFWLFIIYIYEFRKLYTFINATGKTKFNSIFQYRFYKRQLKNNDIVHVQFGNNHQPFEIIKKIEMCKIKLIVSFHGHDAFFPIFNFLNEGYYDTLFQYVDTIVANTPYLVNQLKEIGCPEDRIITIPVGLDTSLFKKSNSNTSNANKIKLVTLGRLSKVKGHEYAIEVLDYLRLQGMDVSLTIIGEGEEREKLEKLVEEKKLSTSVSLVGAKGSREIVALFNTCDIFIFTSVALENERRETQGLAVIEAQSCGLPVVVFDSGGVRYTLSDGESGFVVPEYGIVEMSKKIELLAKNDQMRAEMGRNAINFAHKNFSLIEIEKKWDSLYKFEK